MQKTNNNNNKNASKDAKKGEFIHYWWECKFGQPLRKTV